MNTQIGKEDLTLVKQTFRDHGYCVIEDYLTDVKCKEILAQIEDFRGRNKLLRIQRKVHERSLDYYVIDGHQIGKSLPDFQKIFKDVEELINELDTEGLIPLADVRAALNVNITAPGGEYRWHYDRNRVTALLYLNRVEGGEIEFCPKYRWKLSNRRVPFLQEVLDFVFRLKTMRKVFARTVTVTPAAGRLLIMRGDVSLHSVRPVTGNEWRFNLVMAYDPPGNVYGKSAELDRYLYDAT